MDDPCFSVGQEAESKCFTEGYRGAWFRCRIKGISERKGELGFSLEFFDYPDEKIHWTRMFQKPPVQGNQSKNINKEEIMVRPPFPTFYRESQLPLCDSSQTSGVVVVIRDDWKVGDLVDWLYEDCYWSGRISKLLGNDEVLIKLLDPPLGEGECYVARCDDLRPSLNWSLKDGWTIPKGEQENGDYQSCARLFHNQGAETIVSTEEHPIAGAPEICSEDKISQNAAVISMQKISSITHELRYLDYLEDIWNNESNYWASAQPRDTIDLSIMELEELSNKIMWLKDLLKFGIGWSNAMKPSWKYMENHEKLL